MSNHNPLSRMSPEQVREYLEEQSRLLVRKTIANTKAMVFCHSLEINPRGIHVVLWFGGDAQDNNLQALSKWIDVQLQDPDLTAEAEFTPVDDLLLRRINRVLARIEDSTPW